MFHHQALNGIWPHLAKSCNYPNSRNSFAVFSMTKYIPMHEFHLPVSRSMRAQTFREKYAFFLVHQQPFGLRVTPVGPAACDVNTSARLQLGEKDILDMIAFSSICGQNCQGCAGWKLVAFSCSSLSYMGISVILVPSFSGSL